MEKVKSPLNYTGGKYKLLDQIIPLFPKKINNFFDLFMGGGNVFVNTVANNYYASDTNSYVVNLFNKFREKNIKWVMCEIEKIIEFYDLSNSFKNGYEFYNCNSSSGLSSYNKIRFEKLRSDYNNNSFKGFDKDILFYVLVIFGFNNQIRFNRNGFYNMPCGKRDFNKNLRKNLTNFVERIISLNPTIVCNSFSCLDLSKIKEGDFFYADPPYLITTASYNESGGWTEKDEIELLSFLKEINRCGGSFALSNVMEHNGKENSILKKWVLDNNFIVNYLEHNYKNSSYQKKNKELKTKEVLIRNYL
tara:strand:+ start:530 stop:1444 length:915 start_codon:yes stop_codon:yes gene_type:complete